MNDLKPKLFDVLKDYNKEQLMKDLALDTESIESAILKRFSQRETQ